MNYTESSKLYPESSPGTACPVVTPLEKVLLVVIAIVVAIGIGLSIALAGANRARDRDLNKLERKLRGENVCYSNACVTEASNLLKSLDMDVDPCTDFYTFVCGNWLKNTHLIGGMKSQFTKLSTTITLRVKEILEDLENDSALPVHQAKVSQFHASCMNKFQRNMLGADELQEDLKKFGGWPLLDEKWEPSSFKWDELMVNLFKSGYLSNMFFTIRNGIDPENTTRTIINVMNPSLGLKHRIFYFALEDLVEAYKETIFKLAKLLNSDIKKPEAMDDINNAFEIELKIANLTTEVTKDPRHRYHIMTLKELENFAPKIPWKRLFQNILPSDTELLSTERISITSPILIKSLNNFLEEIEGDNGKKILANYMFYRAVFFAAHYLSMEFHSLTADLSDRMGTGPLPLWHECLRTTMETLHIPLTTLYAKKYLDNQTKDTLRTIVEDLKNALAHDVQNSNWLDEETKNHALLKVKNMRAVIGYDDTIMDDETMDDYYKDMHFTKDYFKNVKESLAFTHRNQMKGLNEKHIRMWWPEINNLLTANAYYRPDQNAIIIPVGILQDPFFLPNRPNYVNYGSLGMVVGHEMTHAFDSIGGLYDYKGNYKMWWSKNSWKKFEERTKCYKNQYNRYYESVAREYVNGTQTLAENIADNGGLQAAYYAYNEMFKRLKTEKSLPGLPYTEKQMFWISFGVVWCKKQTEHNIIYAMKHFMHTPSKFRVIGSASNQKEFSDDFKCKHNSSMNPESKCLLWK